MESSARELGMNVADFSLAGMRWHDESMGAL
jgi:hypothetical protein